jgi:large repetitive protein
MKNLSRTRGWLKLAMLSSVVITNLTMAQELDEKCVINILNRTIQVAENGGWSLPNVPSNQGSVRARATCLNEQGATVSGQSGYFNLLTNGITRVGDIYFAEQEPVPDQISFASTSQISLTSIGQNYQLTVTATYPGGIEDNVTTALSGTNYTSSNSAVVSVSANGLLTAIKSGNSLITAAKDGEVATRLIRVSFTGDQDGDGLPDDYEAANGLDPTDPADAFEDRDNDGLSALDEYNAGTDVNKKDSDNDSVLDGEELILGADGYITNPLLADSDADGLSDSVEITVGSDPSDGNDTNFADAVTAITSIPSNIIMTFNGIDSEVSTQLRINATILDGSRVDVTAKSNGTTYSSSDLTIVSFGLEDGEIFGGLVGQATISVELFGKSVSIPVKVESFQPAGISSLSYTGQGRDVDVQGDFVYIAAGTEGLLIVDASDKANPSVVKTVATSGTAVDVKVVGSIAYVAVSGSGLDIINIAQIESASLVTNFATSGTAVDLSVQNGHIFVANSVGGFEIINVDDPAAPYSVSKLENLGNLIGVDAQNDRAVVVNSNAMMVIDIGDYSSPVRLGSINIGNLRAVVMDGDYAYVACYTCGYKVIKITDAMSPRIVGGDTRFYPSDVELTNGFAFFSDVLFVNSVPFVNIADPENSLFQGVIDIRQFGDRDADALALDAGFVYSVGSNRLYISQYRVLNDSQGIAPTVNIVSPPDGDIVVEGSRILVRATATDDVAVASVDLLINGTRVATDTTRPYEFPYRVNGTADSIDITVQAIDFGNNIGGDAARVTVEPDEDGDGLGDNEEVFTWGTDPEDADTDDDMLSDGQEISIGSNPLNVDSDSDGRNDGDEVNAGTDPLNPDITPPQVSMVEPMDVSIDVCENQSVVVTFNETLQRNSVVQTNFQLLLNDVTEVAGSLTLTSANTSMTFNPSGLLADNSNYTIRVNNVRDSAGNPMTAEFTSSFTTGNCVDLERPFLASMSPVNGTNNIPVNARIALVFNEPVEPETVTESSIFVRDDQGTNIPGIIQLTEDNSGVSFTSNVPFLVGRRHYIYITSTILDLFGNPFVATTPSFITSFDQDGDGPLIVGTSVADGAQDIPLNVKLGVLFDEAISALFIDDINLLDSNGVEVEVSRSLSQDRSRVLLSPLANLNPNENYELVVDGVQDLSGNLLANLTRYQFTTSAELDTATGAVTAVSIVSNNSQNVPTNPLLQVTFSEPVDPSTVNANSFWLQDNATARRIPGQTVLSNDNKTLTYILSEPLDKQRYYYWWIGYQAFHTDISGNFIAQYFYRYFKTGDDVDESLPTITASNFGINATDIPVNGKLIFTLDQPISDACSLLSAVQLFSGDTLISATVSLASDRSTVTISPDENFVVDTAYEARISGLCDYAGNVLAPTSIGFTTSSTDTADTSAPNLVSISPAHTSTDIAVDSNIVIEFDEPISQLTAPLISGGGITVSGNYVIEGSTLTFTPDYNFIGSTRYTVSLVNNIYDLAGNRRNLGNKYFDTIISEDNVAPTVLAITPIADSSDIHPSQTIVLTFSEPMNINTINSSTISLFTNGGLITPSVNRSADGRTVTLSANMPAGGLISVIVSAGVEDLSANPVAPYVSSFTTSTSDDDTTRPRVISQIPANGSRNWLQVDDIYFYMSEAMDEGSLVDGMHLAIDGVLLEADISLIGDGRTVKVSPDTPIVGAGYVQIFWSDEATDINGNALNNYTGYFYTSSADDNIGVKPTVEAIYPTNSEGEELIPLNAVFYARFNEEMDAATINTDNVHLRLRTNGGFNDWPEIAIEVTLQENNRIMVVKTIEALAADSSYYFYFGDNSQILDSDGDSLYSYGYYLYTQTGSVIDDRAPIVEIFSPPNGQQGVGINPRFALRFDEPVNPVSMLNEDLQNVLFGESNRTMQYALLAPLTALSEHTEISPTIVDWAGNQITRASTTFTTANGPDTTQPSVLDISIDQSQTNVPVDFSAVFRFDEPIDPVSVTESGVYMRDVVLGENIPITTELSADGLVLTLTPQQALLSGRQYYVYAYYLRDLSGNNAANNYRYFTTGFAGDTQVPVITATTIDDGEIDVPINARFNLRFDESLRPFSDDSFVSLKDSNGDTIPVRVSLSRSRTLLSIVPLQLLTPMSDYILNVEGMRDLSGNTQTIPWTANFSTGSDADLTKGTITSWSLPASANVATNPLLQVTLSEAIDRAGLESDTIFVIDNNTGIRAAGEWQLSNDRRTLTFVLDNALSQNHSHYFQISYSPYLTDLAGNLLAQNSYRYFTTTFENDEAAPIIDNSSVQDGNIVMPTNGQIILLFSESVSTACNLNEGISLTTGAQLQEVFTTLSSDGKTLTISPTQSLAPNANYSLTVSNLCDYSGNRLAEQQIAFSTTSDIDSVAPSFVSISPAHQAVDVTLDLAQIVIEFDEPINALVAPTVTGGGITVPGTYQVSGNTVTFIPAIDLIGDTRYTISFSNRVYDLAGNSRSIGNKYFNTAVATDTTAPTIVSITPTSDATDVNPGQTVNLTFSEPIASSSLTRDNIGLYSNGSYISPNITRSADGIQVTITANIPTLSLVSVILNDGVTDLSGNPIAPFVSSFTTSLGTTDTGRPTVTAQIPANNISDVKSINTIHVYFSEALDPLSLEGSFAITEDGVAINTDIELVGDNRTIKITKTSEFTAGALVALYLDQGISDLSGNRMNYYSSSFRMFNPTDAVGVRPRVTAYYPTSSIDVLNPVFTAKFDEPLDAASLNADSVILYDTSESSWLPIPKTIVIDDSLTLISVIPDSNLEAGKQYYVQYLTGILDTDGDMLASNYGTYVSISADAAEDDRQPMITALNPPDGQTNVGTNAMFSVRFDESMNPLLFDDKAGQRVAVQFSEDNKVLRYTNVVPMLPSSDITETIDSMTDVAGNQVVADSVTITTGIGADFVRPSIVDQSFTNNQQDVPLNAVVEWVFNEPLDLASLTDSGVYLYNNTTRANVASSWELSPDGMQLSIMPDEVLTEASQYYAYAYGIRDVSGNGTVNNYIYFTTAFTEDSEAPLVTDTTVFDGQTDVPTNVRLNVRFNEVLNPLLSGTVELRDIGNNIIPTNISLSRGRTLLTIVPRSVLLPLSSYTLTVSGIKDLANNQLASELSTSFTTGETVDFAESSFNIWPLPANLTGTPLNPWLELSFYERIDPTTVDNDSFYLYNNTINAKVIGDWNLSNDGIRLQFIPDDLLASNNQHYLYITSPYITDLSGNRLAAGAFRYFTTGTAQDDISPSIEELSVAEGITEMPVNGRVVIYMSEQISDTCWFADNIEISAGGNPIATQVDLNSDRRTLLVKASNNLEPDTDYSVVIKTLCDYAHNQLSNVNVVNFTTNSEAANDTAGPVLNSITPAHQSIDVALDSTIIIEYDEIVDLRAKPPITLNNVQVAGIYSVVGNVITFTPTEELQEGSTYSIRLVNTVADLVGNLRNNSTKTFTTVTP